MATPISPLPQPADAELFLGVPPDGVPRRLLGRVTWVWRDVRRVFDEGHLTFADGQSSVTWVAQAGAVRRHGRLFRPETWVVATGFEVGGPVYLTAVREATQAEVADALETVHALRGDTRYEAGAA